MPGDIAEAPNPEIEISGDEEIQEKTVRLVVNQVCDGRYLILGGDRGRRYGKWGAEGLKLIKRGNL